MNVTTLILKKEELIYGTSFILNVCSLEALNLIYMAQNNTYCLFQLSMRCINIVRINMMNLRSLVSLKIFQT